jgi:hypothetical protein
VGGTVKLANIHHVALICEKSSFVVVNVEMVWRREDRHDRRKTGCLGLAIHLVPGNLTFSTWACVIGIVVGSGEGACKLMRWRDSNGEALGEQKKTVTGGKVSQDMVCDIAPEQRYDTTGKRWPQRSEKDLGAYKKRQGCCSLLPDVGGDDKIGLRTVRGARRRGIERSWRWGGGYARGRGTSSCAVEGATRTHLSFVTMGSRISCAT